MTQDRFSSFDDNIKKTDWEALRRITQHCLRTAERSGWWTKYFDAEGKLKLSVFAYLPEVLTSKIALISTEAAEAIEEVRKRDEPLGVYYTGEVPRKLASQDVWVKLPVEGDYTYVKSLLAAAGEVAEPKPEGLPIELADVVIRAFDLAERFNIDIVDAIEKKMRFNETRSFRHGGKKL